MVRRSADLDPDPTGLYLLEERDQLRSRQLPLHDHLASVRRAGALAVVEDDAVSGVFGAHRSKDLKPA